MSQITIQCRLVAPENTRRYLWELMAEKNTPLINELLWQINNHQDFEQWQSEGKLPETIVSELCKSLKTDPLYARQPSRFYASAIKSVSYIYKSWLKLQQRRQRKLEGQQRWLSILKSDIELLKQSQCSLDILRKKAKEILTDIEFTIEQEQSKNQSNSDKILNKSSLLFDLYDETEDTLTRSGICYLLKNGSKLPKPDKPEDNKKLARNRRKVAIKIERLQEQIEGSRPHGRDLTGEQWLETLVTAATTVPDDDKEARAWQDILLTKPKTIPFPITFETNEDLKWFGIDKQFLIWLIFLFSIKNQFRFSLLFLCLSPYLNSGRDRLFVHFNGLSQHKFQIYCDCRQLKWFKRFFEDQQTKKEGQDRHSSGLFTLRSAKLAWKEDEKQGLPWNRNHLILYCTIDTRLWTAEGTEQFRKEQIAKYQKKLLAKKPELTFLLFFRCDRMKEFWQLWKIIISYQLLKLLEKGDLETAKKNQQNYIKRLESSLEKINRPYPRPSQPLYQSKPNIILGVAMGLEKPATVAIIDGNTGEAIAFRSIKQLLSENYRLLNRQRQQKQTLSHLRHKAQKRSGDNRQGESNLGEYIDRLIAKAIIKLAQQYQVSAIAVPQLEDMREIVQSEVKAKAEDKIPGYEEGQRQYAKQYRMNIHNWSYGRLIESIATQANKLSIVLKEIKQPVRGSPTQKAQEMAILAHQAFNKT